MDQNEEDYPVAVKPKKVGKYPAAVYGGGGYFYDELLEYRVWIHPEDGGEDHFDGDDYYYAFETYEEALEFSKETKGAEEPIALVLQKEWIDEPEPNEFYHKKGKRITEWHVEWLKDKKRSKTTIPDFLKKHSKK
jgi:hypothetical protein